MTVEFEKLEKDGKIAVLYSPGFGAGWFTWNTEHQFLLFDKDLVQLVLDGNNDQAAVLAEKKCPDVYTGGAKGLSVKWIDKGSFFEVEEHDGSESIHVIGDRDYLVA